MQCVIQHGNAKGGYDEEIGYQSSAEKCSISVGKKRKNANGMTWESDTHKCFAEFNANRIELQCLSCQACIFQGNKL